MTRMGYERRIEAAPREKGKTRGLALVARDANFDITFRCGPEVLDL